MFHSFSFKFLIHFVSGGLPVSPVTIWMWLKSREIRGNRKIEKRKEHGEVKGELHDQWKHPLSNAIHAFPFLPRLLLYLSIKDHEHCWIKLFTHCLQIYQRLSLFKCSFIVGDTHWVSSNWKRVRQEWHFLLRASMFWRNIKPFIS